MFIKEATKTNTTNYSSVSFFLPWMTPLTCHQAPTSSDLFPLNKLKSIVVNTQTPQLYLKASSHTESRATRARHTPKGKANKGTANFSHTEYKRERKKKINPRFPGSSGLWSASSFSTVSFLFCNLVFLFLQIWDAVLFFFSLLVVDLFVCELGRFGVFFFVGGNSDGKIWWAILVGKLHGQCGDGRFFELGFLFLCFLVRQTWGCCCYYFKLFNVGENRCLCFFVSP